MNIKSLNEEIEKINRYLENCRWMDFEICQLSFIRIEVGGQIDEILNKFAILIFFEQPTFVQCPLLWGLDDSKKFIELASEEEFKEINKKYFIEEGNFLFKINMEDYKEPAYIAARDIKCCIHDENPFRNFS